MALSSSLPSRRATRVPPPAVPPAFAVAVATLSSDFGLVPTGTGQICFEPGSDAAETTEAELLAETAASASTSSVLTYDPDGRVVVRLGRDDEDFSLLMSDLMAIAGRLIGAGFGASLRYVALDFTHCVQKRRRRAVLVYLVRRGTFYPIVPTAVRSRDLALELTIGAAMRVTIPLESDLVRWRSL